MEKSKTWIERERDFALRSWTPQSCWDGSSLRGDLWILSNPNQNPRVTEIDKLILWLIQKAEGSKRATTMWKTRDTCGGLTLIVIERQEWRFCGTGKGKEQRLANHSNRAFRHTHTHTQSTNFWQRCHGIQYRTICPFNTWFWSRWLFLFKINKWPLTNTLYHT